MMQKVRQTTFGLYGKSCDYTLPLNLQPQRANRVEEGNNERRTKIRFYSNSGEHRDQPSHNSVNVSTWRTKIYYDLLIFSRYNADSKFKELY